MRSEAFWSAVVVAIAFVGIVISIVVGKKMKAQSLDCSGPMVEIVKNEKYDVSDFRSVDIYGQSSATVERRQDDFRMVFGGGNGRGFEANQVWTLDVSNDKFISFEETQGVIVPRCRKAAGCCDGIRK